MASPAAGGDARRRGGEREAAGHDSGGAEADEREAEDADGEAGVRGDEEKAAAATARETTMSCARRSGRAAGRR